MTSTDGLSLREQLGGSADPDFEVKLPAGWERRTPDEADRVRMEAGMKQRLMEAHLPDVYAKLRGMLAESYEAMQKNGVIAYYAATQTTDTIGLPGTMVASIRKPPAGGTLDDLVRHAIREYGATPLFGDKRFVRFERERTTRIDDGAIVQDSITYLTPVPGSGRRRALEFHATFARPVDSSGDEEQVKLYKSTFDLIVSTLRWIPPSSS